MIEQRVEQADSIARLSFDLMVPIVDDTNSRGRTPEYWMKMNDACPELVNGKRSAEAERRLPHPHQGRAAQRPRYCGDRFGCRRLMNQTEVPRAVLSLTMAATMIVAASPMRALSGPLTTQFRHGYEGVRWGTPLSALQASRPGGSVAAGAYPGYKAIRTYRLPDERPLFGISRPRMTVSYGICVENVKEMRFYFPLSSQSQLLKKLTILFGRYATARTAGSTSYYEWPGDDVLRLSMQAKRAPLPGTLAVSVINEKEEYSVFPECGVPRSPAYGEPQ